MVIFIVFVRAPDVAEMLAVVLAVTAFVVTVKVALVAPDATFTEAGTVAFALSDFSVIVVPFDPAGRGIWTVPVELPPPTNSTGLRA